MTGSGAPNLSDIKRQLLELRVRQQRAARAESERILPIPREGTLAVAEQQRYLWFLHQLSPHSPAYNQPFAIRLRGDLDVPALQAALLGVVTRHEALRTRFGSERGVPCQVVDPPPASWPLPVAEANRRSAQEWIDGRSRVPMDLEHGPVFRSSLLRLAPDEHVLLLVVHHIVIDGWSVGTISAELATRYNAQRSGHAAEFPDLPLQPADHAAWQRRQLTGAAAQEHLDYWRSTLDGAEELDFPTDRPRPANAVPVGAIVEATVPADVADTARKLAQTERVSFLAVLHAAFLMVLQRHTGQRDLMVGSVFSGRTRTEIEPLVGFFANTLVLRASLEGNPTFQELAHRCNDTAVGALAHQDAPFGMVVDALQPDRTPGRNPLFQVMFTMLTSGIAGEFRFGDLQVEPMTAQPGTARFDLTFQVSDVPDGDLGIWVEYSRTLFDPDRVRRLIEQFRTVLRQAVAAPTMPIDAVEVLPDAERAELLTGWNPAPTPRPGGLLHHMVTRQARERPDHVAMRFGDAELTYSELDARSSRLAAMLAEDLSVAPGRIVGVLLERGLGLPAAQLGVLKAGAAWLPLDPQYPDTRLQFQVADADVAAVVTTSDLADRLPAATPRLCLDAPQVLARLDGRAGGSGEAATAAAPIDPEDTAYVIYTSGSTGAPKGVMVPHRAAVAFCQNVVELFSITSSDQVLQFSNPAFDVSVFDFYGAFAGGATVVGAPRSELLDPDALQAMVRRERISIVDIPPAVLNLLAPEELNDLRLLWVGMEPFSAELVNQWSAPDRQFHNGYGPTEATVTCVDYLCPPEPLDAPPPIGRPMVNQRAYVLDEALRPAPAGVPGELFLAGTGLAQGYLGRPELTAESFLPDPFAERPGERMYRTGDVVRWRVDGNLEFLGRVDRQIKIRGLRIELGEIEHVLASHPDTRQAAVVVKDLGTPHARLIGYAALTPGREVDGDQLREHLADRLPLHMVPSAVLILPALPLTANNKLDEARLPEPDTAQQTEDAEPSTDAERALAEIWSDLLDVDIAKVGRQANFFDLGGNSLQATQLISRVRDSFHISLHPRDLFTRPVLGQLAGEIDAQLGADGDVGRPGVPSDGAEKAQSAATRGVASLAAQDSRSPLVPIDPTGTRPAFFCVHAGAGSVVPYAGLARLLGPEQPFYGLEDPGLHDGASAETLTDAAATYILAIQEIQPSGPYYLGGWSAGGNIALEMAGQLRAAGEPVAIVALLDTTLPPGADPAQATVSAAGASPDEATTLPDHAELLGQFVGDVTGIAGAPAAPLSLASLRDLDEDAQVEAALTVLDRANLIPDGTYAQMASRMLAFVTNSRAFYRHRQAPYDGRVVLLHAAAERRGGELSRWQALAPDDFSHQTVPGDHYTMLQRPHVPVLAEALHGCLEAAQTAGGAP